MNFQLLVRQILLIFNSERTISAPYHLLKGKKSSQTLEDAVLFHLQPYYHLLPFLTRESYDAVIAKLCQQGDLQLTNERYTVKPPPQQSSHFDGFSYRGGERVFFARLQLLVQTLSQRNAQNMKFVPVVTDLRIQRFVKQFLRRYTTASLAEHLYKEIVSLLADEAISDWQRLLFTYRLSGYEQPAQTLEQLASTKDVATIDAELAWLEALHYLLKRVESPLLLALLEGCIVSEPLTVSAAKTLQFLAQGYTLEQVANERKLKLATIHDHVIEIARNRPTFDITPYVEDKIVRRVHQAVATLKTRRLKVLQQTLNIDYFTIRLALTREV